MFEKGDLVKCIKPYESLDSRITLGKTYRIEAVRLPKPCPFCNGDCRIVYVINDHGVSSSWCPTRFELVIDEVEVPGVGKVTLTPRRNK